ncbi:MAG TPA: hypothetical protein VKD67_10175 [Acidimicrobiales bacterium]|nr:hypothetical protein [Acidimicrobiales bacterium]
MVDRVEGRDGRDTLRVAVEEMGRACYRLDARGAAAVERARDDLEQAVGHLGSVAFDHRLPPSVRQRAQRCREALSAHLVATQALDAAGVSPTKVAGMLHRGAEMGAAEVTACVNSVTQV